MTTKLKLWISPGTCSLLPHVMFREAGLDFDLFVVDIVKAPFPEEYKRINPKARVPILEIGDGNILTETAGIVTYAAQVAPEKKLLGTTPLEVARTYEWLNWLSGTVHERGFGATFKPSSYTDEESAFPGVQKKCKEFLMDCMRIIEEKIEGIHAVGDVFTAADVFLFVIYRWGYLLQWDMTGLYPKWTKLVDEVIKRDTIKAAVEKEGIPMIHDDRKPPPGVK